MRMSMQRFTPVTNAFSNKAENLMAAVSLHFMHLPLRPPPQSSEQPLPTTPAMRRESRIRSGRSKRAPPCSIAFRKPPGTRIERKRTGGENGEGV